MVYSLVKKKGKIYKIIFAIHSVLVFSSSSRGAILWYIILIAISYPIFSRIPKRKIVYKYVKYGVPSLILLFSFLFPVIELSRGRLQEDVYNNREEFAGSKSEIVLSYVTGYVPRAAKDYVTGDYSSRGQNEHTYLRRFSMYQDTMEHLIDTKTSKSTQKGVLWKEVSLLIPRIIYPNKPIVQSSETLTRYLYGGITAGGLVDIPATPITMAYYLGGGIGVLLLLGISGAAFGVAAQVLRRTGPVAPLLMVGFIPLTLPMGNALMSQIIGARDIIVFSALFIFLTGRWKRR